MRVAALFRVALVLSVLTAVLSARFVADAATSPAPGFSPVPFNDWVTYQYDVAHDGYNPNSGRFTPANAPSLHLAWVSQSHDFNTGAQPILITNVGSHAALLVYGGGSGNLYAVDALSGSLVWKRQLGNTHFDCGGNAQFGIAGTAVYSPSLHALFASSTSNAGTNAPARVLLYKLDPATGRVLAGRLVNAAALPGELDFTHTGLTLAANGLLYIGTGSTCDVPWWRGSMSVLDATTLRVLRTFYTVYDRTDQPNPGPYSGGGVWGWGGATLDSRGHVYFGVGNADIDSGSSDTNGTRETFEKAPAEYAGYGEHLVELSPDLSTVIGSNLPTPPTMYRGASQDIDFSGTPVMAYPLACTQRVAGMSKSGGFYLYNAGLIGAGPLKSYQFGPSAFYATSFSTPAYSPVTGFYYAAVSSSMFAGALESPGMAAIAPCAPYNIVWNAAFGPDAYGSLGGGYPRSAPTVTAGNLVLMGTACASDAAGACGGSSSAIGGAVWIVDATTGTVLNGGLPLVRTPNDVRMAPVVDGDWAYVLDNGGTLYGFTLDPGYKPISAPQGLRPDPRAIVRWRK